MLTRHFSRSFVTMVLEGGFALITGETGLGKSTCLRALYEHLFKIPEITVGDIILISIGTRMRTRLTLELCTKTRLLELLKEVINKAGNPNLMSAALAEALAEHAAGTPRVIMNLASECLAMGMMKEAPQLDEGIFFELYPASHGGATRKRATLQAAK